MSVAFAPFAPFAPFKKQPLFPDFFACKPQQLVGHLLLRIFDSEDGFIRKDQVVAAMQTEIEGIADHPQMAKLSEQDLQTTIETIWDVYLCYVKPYFLYKQVYEMRKVRRFAERLADGSLDQQSLLQVLEEVQEQEQNGKRRRF